MRELYKSGHQSSTSSACSIVAKAVAKIEQDKKEAVEKQLLNTRKANNSNIEASQSTLEPSINNPARDVEATSTLVVASVDSLEIESSPNNVPGQSRSENEHSIRQGDCNNKLVQNKSGDNSFVSDSERLLFRKPEDDCVGFYYQRLQERTSPYDFESALEDFDRTAKDVLTFVQERSDHLQSSTNQQNLHQESTQNPSSKTDITNSSSDDGDSIDDSGSDDSSDSSKDIVKEGLETITEECGGQTTTSIDETDESEQEQDASLQFCKPVQGDACSTNRPTSAWVDEVDEVLSSTTDTDKDTQVNSSTETEDLNGSKDSSTRCNADFQWIRKDPVQNSSAKSNHTNMDTDEEADDQTSPTSSSNNNSSNHHKSLNPDQSSPQHSKPPINRASDNQPHRHRRSLPQGNQSGQAHSLGSSPEKAMSPNSNCSSGGSLDRRRYHNHSHDRNNRFDRDQKSRSQHMLKSPPPRLDDYTMNNQREYSPSLNQHHFHNPLPQTQQFCQNWCCSQNHNPQSLPSNPFMVDQPSMYQPPSFNQHQQRRSIDRFGSGGPIHLDSRGSHPDLYKRSHHENNHQNNCCQYHNMMVPPPMLAPPIGGCCGYHWLQPISPIVKPGDLDEKCRKLQSERDNLQLQVQVLSEQIEAQSDKIVDLEKRLGEKKQVLSNTEDLLQRETLSRSSLETQKLELISQISELKLHQASVERENLELRCHYNNNTDHHHHGNRKQVPAYLHRMSPQPTLTSTPVHTQNQGNIRVSPSPSPVTISSMTPSARPDGSPKTPPATYKRQIELHYSSLPRQQYLSNGGAFTLANSTSLQAQHPPPTTTAGRQGAALQAQRGGFGRLGGILLSQYSGVHAGLRLKGHSVPNLAETEKIVIDDNSTTFPVTDINDLQQQQSLNNNNNNKNKGIKKIFGKMKRSGSGNLEDLPPGLGVGEFQRGGVRATASPRLGWTEPASIIKKPPPSKPFADWDTPLVCDWLSDLGLDQYVLEARRWVKSGQQLQEASTADYEKELQIKSSLHKKKLQLALIDVEANGSSDTLLAQAGKLDTAWVLRWLDDVGLPQYKEAFLQQRIDGRVLHRLTMDDLTTLHVTSALHAASLRRGIQVLRERNYDASCLQRRAVEDEEDVEEEGDLDGSEDGSSRKINTRTPLQISLWTSHRVMQWLREVDLAEYAPNLRGAGVHGAIMVLEQRFTADLLAALLSIPPSKTLLRRHLNTRFKELLGCELIQGKREAEGVLGFIALTPQSKLKVPKKSHFSLKRSKSKSEADYGDLVCPMNAAGQSGQDLNDSAINSSMGMTRKTKAKEEDAYLLEDQSNSYPQSAANSPLPLRYESS